MDKLLTLKKEDFTVSFSDYIDNLFGDKLEITVDEDLAKKIYIYYCCNVMLRCQKLGEFIEANFKDKKSGWDDEYLLNSITYIEKELKKDNYLFNDEIDKHLTRILGKYTSNKEVLGKIIKIIEVLCKKSGYRAVLNEEILHDDTHGPNPSPYDYLVGQSVGLIYKNEFRSHIFNSTSCGFIQCLFYNGYLDLAKECIDRILAPCANACFIEDRDYTHIWAYQYYEIPKKKLLELSEEIFKYFDYKIDNRIKRWKTVRQKCCLEEPPFTRVKMGVRASFEGDMLFGDLFKIENDICVTNLNFIDSYDALEDDITIEVINEDEDMDIAIVQCDCSNIVPVYAVKRNLQIGDYIHIEGEKAFFDKRIKSYDRPSLSNFAFSITQKDGEFSAEQILNNFIVKQGDYLPKQCISFGVVVEITEKGYIVDAPYAKDVYGAAAYAEDGSFVGIVKVLKENSDFVEIISYDSITELIDETIAY